MQRGADPIHSLTSELRGAFISARMKRALMLGLMGRDRRECIECMAASLKVIKTRV